jgi:hypothetical protein
MKLRFLLPVVGLAALAGNSMAQTYQRNANMRGGNGSEGKCTIEVVVDGAAQVEIRGASASLTNLNGQQPQWRRFECTSAMPANPEGFRFTGVDGRGRQQLVRAPRNGSPAVVEIVDPDNGSEGYTFDLTWNNTGYVQPPYQPQYQNNNGQYNNGQYNNGQYNNGQYNNGQNDRYNNNQGRGNGRGQNQNNYYIADRVVQVCEDNVRQQALARYRGSNIQFRDTTIDDNPGRADYVIGTVDVRTPGRPDQQMKFSCSVDFNTGQVRSADLQPAYGQGWPDRGGRDQDRTQLATDNCERAVQQRVREDGFRDVTFGNTRIDQDRGSRVTGDLRAYGRYGSQSFRFSCDVDARDGDVKSIDVTRRNER